MYSNFDSAYGGLSWLAYTICAIVQCASVARYYRYWLFNAILQPIWVSIMPFDYENWIVCVWVCVCVFFVVLAYWMCMPCIFECRTRSAVSSCPRSHTNLLQVAHYYLIILDNVLAVLACMHRFAFAFFSLHPDAIRMMPAVTMGSGSSKIWLEAVGDCGREHHECAKCMPIV